MAAISSGQVIACLRSLRTRAAASSALSLAGLPAGTGGAALAGSLAAAGRGVALFSDRAVLAVFWGVLLGEVFFMAAMLLPWYKTGNRALRLPRYPPRVSTVTSLAAPVQGNPEENSAFSSRSGMSPKCSPRDGRPAAALARLFDQAAEDRIAQLSPRRPAVNLHPAIEHGLYPARPHRTAHQRLHAAPCGQTLRQGQACLVVAAVPNLPHVTKFPLLDRGQQQPLDPL